MQASSETAEVRLTASVASVGFDAFFADEHERLFRTLYFVTGDRHDAEELMQDSFLELWERWDQVLRIEDPQAYLFRAAPGGFRMRRRRAAVALRKLAPAKEDPDPFQESEIRADEPQDAPGAHSPSESGPGARARSRRSDSSRAATQ